MAKLLTEKGLSVDLVTGGRLGGQFASAYNWQRLNTPTSYFSLPGIRLVAGVYLPARELAAALQEAVITDRRISLLTDVATSIHSADERLRVCFLGSPARLYRHVIMAIGRPEMRRHLRLEPGWTALDPYVDISSLADHQRHCVVLGSGATAVDCAVELCLQGRKVDLVVRHRLHCFPRVHPGPIGKFIVRNARRKFLAPLFGVGGALLKASYVKDVPEEHRAFFDQTLRGGPIVVNDYLIDMLLSRVIRLFWWDCYELSRELPIFNCIGYESNGSDFEIVLRTPTSSVVRLGKGFSRAWLPYCLGACRQAYEIICCSEGNMILGDNKQVNLVLPSY